MKNVIRNRMFCGIGVAVPQGRHAPGRRVLDTPGSAQLCGGAPVVSGRGG